MNIATMAGAQAELAARRTCVVAVVTSTFWQMTIDESADTGEAPKFPAIAPVAEVFGRPDVTLQTLSNFSTAFGVGLTLFLPWGVATGTTIGHREFYADVAEKFRAAPVNVSEGNGTHEQWEAILDDFAARNFDVVVNESAEERSDRMFQDGFDLNTYLHLRDVRCYVAALPQPLVQDYMRIRLTDVTGWSYGIAAV